LRRIAAATTTGAIIKVILGIDVARFAYISIIRGRLFP
jgi:hypothetical protein